MTDDDFDKIDEDFANEFDFVDPKAKAGTAAATSGSRMTGKGGTGKTTGSPAIMTFLIIFSALGLGFWGYTHFIANKKPELPLPMAPHAEHEANAGEHPQANNMEHQLPNELNPPAAPQAGNTQHPGLPPDQLSNALPQETKSFEEVQKELQTSRSTATQSNVAQHAVNAEFKTTMQQMSEEMTTNVNNIKQLEATIGQLATTIDQLNKSITAMDNRVLGLTETVDSLSQDLANVKKVIAADDLDLTNPGIVKFSPNAQVTPMSNTVPNFNVHAIIPGRAWLKSAGGQIITVTEGDKIGDYGTIAVIDAANGMVRTSSGIIFR